MEEDERLAAEERAREAKKPRHHDLTLSTLTESEDLDKDSLTKLDEVLQHVCKEPHPRRVGEDDTFTFDVDSEGEDAEVADLRNKLNKLKVVARAKVTQDRVYSMAYHPEIRKDLIFFGGETLHAFVAHELTRRMQTNTDSWESGTPGLRSTKLMMKTIPRCRQRTRRVVNIGDCRLTGRPHLNLQYHVSSFIL